MAISAKEEKQLNMMNTASMNFNDGKGLGTTVKEISEGSVPKPSAKITKLDAAAELAAVVTKVNELIDLLNGDKK